VAVNLTPAQSSDARDALCKAMYSHMFDWIVAKINETLGSARAVAMAKHIGILDIFGFEVRHRLWLGEGIRLRRFWALV
jgi:myosin heavy subunit